MMLSSENVYIILVHCSQIHLKPKQLDLKLKNISYSLSVNGKLKLFTKNTRLFQ